MTRGEDRFATHRMSSAALPERGRFGLAREFFAPLVGLEFERIGEEPPAIEAALGELPEIPIFSTRVAGVEMKRTRAGISADGKQGFALTIMRGGEAQVSQHGRAARVREGEAVLTTGADLLSLRFPGEVDGLTIMPSRAPLAALVPDLDDLVARPIPRASEPLRLLARYAAMVHEGPLESPALSHVVATHLFDLTALAIGAGREVAEIAKGRGARAARIAAIKRDIERNLTEPALSIASIAARERISPRYVARLLADEGTSFSDYVRGRRIELARRMLTDPRLALLSISEIAYSCGFGDLSYFNRCFRARLGATPGELRAAMRGHNTN